MGIFDSGATHVENGFLFREADIALGYALALKDTFRAQDVDVFMTRDDATDHAPVGKRAAMAKNAGCDVLISLHLNDFDDDSANGLEVLFRDAEDKALAQKLQDALVTVTKMRDRKIKQRTDLAVLKFQGVAVLVELGFIANDVDRAKLMISKRTGPRPRKQAGAFCCLACVHGSPESRPITQSTGNRHGRCVHAERPHDALREVQGVPGLEHLRGRHRQRAVEPHGLDVDAARVEGVVEREVHQEAILVIRERVRVSRAAHDEQLLAIVLGEELGGGARRGDDGNREPVVGARRVRPDFFRFQNAAAAEHAPVEHHSLAGELPRGAADSAALQIVSDEPAAAAAAGRAEVDGCAADGAPVEIDDELRVQVLHRGSRDGSSELHVDGGPAVRAAADGHALDAAVAPDGQAARVGVSGAGRQREIDIPMMAIVFERSFLCMMVSSAALNACRHLQRTSAGAISPQLTGAIARFSTM